MGSDEDQKLCGINLRPPLLVSKLLHFSLAGFKRHVSAISKSDIKKLLTFNALFPDFTFRPLPLGLVLNITDFIMFMFALSCTLQIWV